MADDKRKQDDARTDRIDRRAAPDPSQAAGDNRRAHDLDGNSAAGNSKSKGPTNPADEPPDA